MAVYAWHLREALGPNKALGPKQGLLRHHLPSAAMCGATANVLVVTVSDSQPLWVLWRVGFALSLFYAPFTKALLHE